MSASEFLLSSRRVATPDGVHSASIHVRAGRIVAVSVGAAAAAGAARIPVVDVGDRAVLPGLLDTHVHINEAGRADGEGFASATAAAAAGGATTLVDMPLNSIPPTTSAEAFGRKLEAAAGRCRVHVGFWGGLVPSSVSEVAHLASAGVFGFTCILVDSGVPEFAPMREKDLEMAMREIARLDALLVVQAEWPDSIASEAEAVRRVVRLCRETGARVHFLRLSRAEALEPLERARSEGLPVTAETCPPHLAPGAKVPPSGENENRDRLWEALGSGVLDMVVSGHPSSRPGCSLPVVWTEARRRGYSLSDLARWMSSAPARLARLETWKGSIAPGQDADLVVFDPEAEWRVEAQDPHHRRELSPHAGRRLTGAVAATYLKGEKIWEEGRDIGSPAGELLLSAGGA